MVVADHVAAAQVVFTEYQVKLYLIQMLQGEPRAFT